MSRESDMFLTHLLWHKADYQIVGAKIQLRTPFAISDDEAYNLYRTNSTETPKYVITFVPGETVPDLDAMIEVFRGSMNSVYRSAEGLLHVFRAPGIPNGFAWNWIVDWSVVNTCTIHYHPALSGYFSSSRGCFNAISVERMRIVENQIIFHCCYLSTQSGAILFTAPSGGGKSTQGNLWEESGMGTVINGDRAVLEMKAGEDLSEGESRMRCLAHGLPIAGSSNIFRNETHPVRAIVVVHKAPVNRIYPVGGMEAFQAVYGQILTHVWDPVFQNRVMDIAQKIVENVPIYHLDCTISQEAVAVTEAALGDRK